MALVYMAINKVNGKRYIGVTGKTVKIRSLEHKSRAKNGSKLLLHKAIRRYGFNKIQFFAIARCKSYDIALKKERLLIAELTPEYNLSLGGEGCLGYRHTEKSKKIMSIKSTGRTGYWKGKKLPPHVIELAKIRSQRIDRKKQWKENSILGPHSRMRPVICLDDGKIFECASSAANFYGFGRNEITAVCLNYPYRKTVKGKRFSFYHENERRVSI